MYLTQTADPDVAQELKRRITACPPDDADLGRDVQAYVAAKWRDGVPAQDLEHLALRLPGLVRNEVDDLMVLDQYLLLVSPQQVLPAIRILNQIA